jgi:hypothetical protein
MFYVYLYLFYFPHEWYIRYWLDVENKKSDAQVGRVNTFHTLQTIRKGLSNFE